MAQIDPYEEGRGKGRSCQREYAEGGFHTPLASIRHLERIHEVNMAESETLSPEHKARQQAYLRGIFDGAHEIYEQQ
jgi:hypothetical protein